MLKKLSISILLACLIVSTGCARMGKGHHGHNKGNAKLIIAPIQL